MTILVKHPAVPPEPAPKHWRTGIFLLALGLLYLVMARVSIVFVYHPVGVASIWPPSGLALAAVLLTRRRRWVITISVLFIANCCANLLGGNSLPVSLAFAAANCAETLLIASLIFRYLEARLNFLYVGQMLGFLGLTVIGTALAALLGAAIPWFSFGANFWQVWLTWWTADSLGIVLVTPLILAWRLGEPGASERWQPAHFAEGAALLGCVSLVTGYLFLNEETVVTNSILRIYLLFPFLIWTGLRFNLRFITALLAFASLIAIVGTLNGLGQFSDSTQSADRRLIMLQLFLFVVIFSTLILNTIVRQLRQAGELIATSEAEYRNLFQNASIGIFHSLPRGGFINVNPSLANMLGYASPQEMISSVTDIVNDLYVDTLNYEVIFNKALQQDGWTHAVNRYRRKDGSLMTGKLSVRKVLAKDGSLTCLEGFLEDISEQQMAEQIAQARLRLLQFASTHNLNELLRATLDEAETLTGSQVGFFHFLDADQITLSLQVWSTRTIQEFCAAQGDGAHYPINLAGVWVDCIRERAPVIHNDYASLAASRRKGMPKGHAALTRELVTPVLRGKNIVSILGVGNKPEDYSLDDVSIVAQLADLAWDIAESKRTEEALKRSETLLNETQSIARVGGWEYDCATKKLIWTQEVYRIYGVRQDYDPNDISQAISFYAPEDQQIIEAAFQNAVNLGQPYDLELGFINAQGEALWVRTRGSPVIRDGITVKITGTIMDITSTKLIEENLNQLNENLEQQLAANEELQAMLLEQATRDMLTGLYNRRFMDDALHREILRAERESYPVSILLLDIDHFKNFNDSFGHVAGDQVLVALSSQLRANFRESDITCRYGGEEFVIILPRAVTEDAWKLAEEFREDFSRLRTGPEGLSATVSVGLAVYPQNGINADELLRAADSAMYAAKAAGRNCVRLA